MTETYCNNCGKAGHVYHQCKIPITSIGIIAFCRDPTIREEDSQSKLKYLMIRRKDTLGHIDFMRGKYSIYNRHYILKMLNQMTVEEKERMKSGDFDFLWATLWGGNAISTQYKNEETISREKYLALRDGVETSGDTYTLIDLINESDADEGNLWTEAEWGFPKGRRNHQEKDFECAIREFQEETGYSAHLLQNVQNILPYEEIFTGSNYKSYKHKYYLMYMNYGDTMKMGQFERAEVSKMEWKTYEECVDCMRGYNMEKKRLITRINQTLDNYAAYFL